MEETSVAVRSGPRGAVREPPLPLLSRVGRHGHGFSNEEKVACWTGLSRPHYAQTEAKKMYTRLGVVHAQQRGDEVEDAYSSVASW